MKNEENSCFFVAAEGFGNVFCEGTSFPDLKTSVIWRRQDQPGFYKTVASRGKKAKDGARRWDTRTTATASTKLNDVGTDFDDVVTHTDVGPT